MTLTERKLRQIAKDCGIEYVGRDENDGYPKMKRGSMDDDGLYFRLHEEAYSERRLLAFLRKLACAVGRADRGE